MGLTILNYVVAHFAIEHASGKIKLVFEDKDLRLTEDLDKAAMWADPATAMCCRVLSNKMDQLLINPGWVILPHTLHYKKVQVTYKQTDDPNQFSISYRLLDDEKDPNCYDTCCQKTVRVLFTVPARG